ncbi:MAG TPA: AbrB/MazE/SpoVT family DNA-binding domain-containing protein [Candidatus Limnocylindria bacterium]|nr:AbrB/MazE/SpoVT family DNA-binding domain-containing protein [Candidatus Limnocylindria bacterium]
MMGITTTVTTKMQVTIPEEIRRIYPVEAGTRLTWTVEGNALVARRVRSVDELAGCLKSDIPFPGIEAEKKGVAELRAKRIANKFGAGTK